MAHELDHVRTVYIESLTGEQCFGLRLIQALEARDCFHFTFDRAHADAILEAHGENSEDGFEGTLTLRDTHGNQMWSSNALRPHGSIGPMAYERLVDQIIRAVSRAELESRHLAAHTASG